MADVVAAPVAVKKPYLSKTLIFNAVVACSALIPGVGEFVSGHVDAILMGLGLVNMALRLVTKEKIGLGE